MSRIESLQNANVKKWASLSQKKYRDAYNLFLVENEHLIKEAIEANILEELVIIEEEVDKYDFNNITIVTDNIMKKISSSTSTAKAIGVCHKVNLDINNPRRVVILDDIQDPGNLGTIIRTATAFGYDAIYLSLESCDQYNSKVIQSSQGALFKMPIYRSNLKDIITSLKKDGFYIVGTSLQESHLLEKVEAKDKMAFVFGNEGNGIKKEILDMCDENVFIEINNFESLNVAVASGIVLYKFSK